LEKVDQVSSRRRLVEPEVKELLAQRLSLRSKLTELGDGRQQKLRSIPEHYYRAEALEQLQQRVKRAKHQRETASEIDPDSRIDSECVDSESECSDVWTGDYDYYSYDVYEYRSDDDFIRHFRSVDELNETVRRFAEDQRVRSLYAVEDKGDEQVYKEMCEESFQKKRRRASTRRKFTKRATNGRQELGRRVQTISELDAERAKELGAERYSSLRARQRARGTLARYTARALRSTTEEQRYEHARKELARMRNRAERTSKARATVHSKKAQHELKCLRVD